MADIARDLRLAAAVSACRRAIIHGASEQALAGEVCDILVESGGCSGAWIGAAEAGDAHVLRPLGQRGIHDGEYLTPGMPWANPTDSGDPAWTAIRTGEPCVRRHITTDPGFAAWKALAEANGYKAAIALPLLQAGDLVGVLSLRAADADAFGPVEVGHLRALAVDLGRGIAMQRLLARTTVDAADRQRLIAQFLQAQKMESVGRLAGGIAHDFNNLLTVIRANLVFVNESLEVHDRRRDDLAEMNAAVDRAHDLAHQLLTLAGRHVGTAKPVDINAAIMQTDKILRRTLGENIELCLLPIRGVWPVNIDPGQLDQVVLNLAVNARDAMPRGGTLTMATANVSLACACGDVAPGDWVTLTVTDTGVGMSPEAFVHVFEPFFTTKGEHGTGLGLATCLGIIREAGGHIVVETEVGCGTSFTIYLPRGREAVTSVAETAIEVPIRRDGGVALVVEDQPAVLRSMSRILREGGFVVVEASSAEEGLSVLERLSTKVHLVVTDVALPAMSGVDLAAKVEARYPGIAVLLTSGYLREELPARPGLRLDTSFLPKPFTPAMLLRKATEALNGRL